MQAGKAKERKEEKVRTDSMIRQKDRVRNR
jgi:hypothetical protein